MDLNVTQAWPNLHEIKYSIERALNNKQGNWYAQNMTKYGFSLTRIFPYKVKARAGSTGNYGWDRQEIMGQRKSVFWHILGSAINTTNQLLFNNCRRNDSNILTLIEIS